MLSQPNTTTSNSLHQATCFACGQHGEISITVVPDFEYCLPDSGNYAECRSCGTLFQHPMPGLDQLAEYYPPTYHAATSHGLLSRLRHAGRLRKLSGLLDGKGAFLDYGCGNGAFLLWVARQGLDRPLFGYEISDTNSIEYLADNAVTIVRGDPAQLQSVLPPCRVISMNHVIEHLPNPIHTLKFLAAALVPGGHLIGQTPASDSLERQVFGCYWSGYHAPRHTVIFSRIGLTYYLTRAGLGNVTISTAFNPAALGVSLSAMVRGPGKGIPRKGPSWLVWLSLATLLAPIDLLSSRGGIIDFSANKPTAS